MAEDNYGLIGNEEVYETSFRDSQISAVTNEKTQEEQINVTNTYFESSKNETLVPESTDNQDAHGNASPTPPSNQDNRQAPLAVPERPDTNEQPRSSVAIPAVTNEGTQEEQISVTISDSEMSENEPHVYESIDNQDPHEIASPITPSNQHGQASPAVPGGTVTNEQPRSSTADISRTLPQDVRAEDDDTDSMCCVITVSLLCACCAGCVFGIPGVIFAAMAYAASDNPRRRKKYIKMAMILNAVGFLIFYILIAAIVLDFSSLS